MKTDKTQTAINDADAGFDPQTGEIHSGKQLLQSDRLEKIAASIIESENFNMGPARIAYRLVYPNITKYRLTKVKATDYVLQHYAVADYLVLVSGELWDMIDDKTARTAVWYAMEMIDPTFNSKSGEWTFSIRQPDITSFSRIIDKEGLDWIRTVQAVASSLYDLDPKQENKVRV